MILSRYLLNNPDTDGDGFKDGEEVNSGYNPNGAIEFWRRMAAEKGGGAPPEFLSTHPSDETRINNIKKLIPEAMTYYKRS